jgi:chloramphenicol-sensitive protein RarD
VTGSPDSPSSAPGSLRSGLAFGIACYGIWGVLPLYLVWLEFAPALEVVAHRALWTAVVCLLILALTGTLGQLVQTLRHPRRMAFLAAAAALISVNWLLYVYAANHREVLQASLGYFINPLLSVGLGVAVLHEKLRRAQWLAIAIAVVAVLVIAIGYGHPPWIALGLAVSFGLYGLTKSLAGRHTGAVASLTIETLLLAPFALFALHWLGLRNDTHFLADGWRSALLLVSTGLVTAAPLTFFAAAARRLPLSLLGMLQYLAPSLQFLIAVTVNHEAMSTSRWTGFILIWCALLVLSADALRLQRQRRGAADASRPASVAPTPRASG